MRTDDWRLTEDVDDFMDRAGDFLRSRPGLHIAALTALARLRARGAAAYGPEAPLFDRLEDGGGVRAAFHRLPSRGLAPTPLTEGQADVLAARLADLGHRLPYVSAEARTAAAFAEAWQRRTGAVPTTRVRMRLHRLGTLTPPRPVPAGRERAVGEEDREQLVRWCAEFAADVGEDVTVDAGSWAGTRFADKGYTFWETPDGTPVSMAGANPMIAGVVQVDPVYTPARLRGRGYAGAVTVAVSRAARAAGAEEVVLYTNAANPTSNALYQRLGYRPVAEWTVVDFAPTGP